MRTHLNTLQYNASIGKHFLLSQFTFPAVYPDAGQTWSLEVQFPIVFLAQIWWTSQSEIALITI